MIRYLTLLFSPIIFLATWWLFFYYGSGLPVYFIMAIVSILLTARVLTRFYFWRHKLLWLNLILVYSSEFLFLLLLNSATARYMLALVLSLVWGFVWWMMSKHFSSPVDSSNLEKFSVTKFLYYLAYWFLIASLYSLVIFVSFSLLYAVLIAAIFTFFWTTEIIRFSEHRSIHYRWLVLWLSLQMLAIVYLLPVSFYVAGTIATLWYFFIIDSITSQIGRFGLYFGLFLAAVAILLTSSLL